MGRDCCGIIGLTQMFVATRGRAANRRVVIFARRLSVSHFLLLLSVLARISAMPGWMPQIASDGSFTLRICSPVGNAPKTITITPRRDPQHEKRDVAAGDECPFATLATAIPLPTSPVIHEMVATGDFVLFQPQHLGFAPGTASPLPPSTGPPAFL